MATVSLLNKFCLRGVKVSSDATITSIEWESTGKWNEFMNAHKLLKYVINSIEVRIRCVFLFPKQPLHIGILSNAAVGTHYVDRRDKHWKPEFKWLRGKKVIKVDLPNFHEKAHEVPQEEKVRRAREKGLQPPRPWTERPFSIACVK